MAETIFRFHPALFQAGRQIVFVIATAGCQQTALAIDDGDIFRVQALNGGRNKMLNRLNLNRAQIALQLDSN